jgi:hypothetical protein
MANRGKGFGITVTPIAVFLTHEPGLTTQLAPLGGNSTTLPDSLVDKHIQLA